MALVETCPICGYQHTRSNAVQLWRKHGYGRLYWKHKNGRMQGWQRDDIAQVKNGVLRIYFTSNEAIIHDALGVMEQVTA